MKLEDHQIKQVSDADLQAEHATALRRKDGELAEQLRREIDRRQGEKAKAVQK